MKLHEIELFAKDPQKEQALFKDLLQLPLQIDQAQLQIYNAGPDLNISTHDPEHKVSLSFLVNDLIVLREKLQQAGIGVSMVKDSHLGLKAFFITWNDIKFVFNQPSENSPDWLRKML